MSESTLWWIVTGFFVSLELLSGSAYLLMLALGAAAAALTALFGLPQPAQLVTATLVGGFAVLIWHLHLLKRGALVTAVDGAFAMQDVEIGSQVIVDHWEADGTCKVTHKGRPCIGRHFGPELPANGLHRIKKLDGAYLILEQI